MQKKQQLVEELVEEGNRIYGKTVFAQIMECYRTLEPYMTDQLKCLETLVTGRGLNSNSCKIIGESLVRELNMYIKRRLSEVTPNDLAFQVDAALEAHRLGVTEGSSQIFHDPPSTYGIRVHTGDTERPGSTHGFDPLTRPH